MFLVELLGTVKLAPNDNPKNTWKCRRKHNFLLNIIHLERRH